MKRITVNCYLLILSVALCAACSGNTAKQSNAEVKLVKIDWNNVSESLDYSSLVEDSVLMFPLETTDECLIGEVTKLIYQNQQIYIADNIGKSIFVFDMSGKLKAKVHAVGTGPGEYSNISYFTVHGTDMVMFDHYMGKFVFYDASGKFIREKGIGGVWATDLFCMGDKLYLPNDGSRSDSGFYHLFTMDLANSDETEKYLPFNEKVNNQSWGIGSCYAKLGNEALVCFWPFDELYTVKDRMVSLSYKIDFGDRRLPKQYIEGDGTTALRTAIRDNYVTGLDRFWQSEQYLFLYFSDSQYEYTTIYMKETGEMQTTKYLHNAKIGNLLLQPNHERFIIQDERIIQCIPADHWNLPGILEQLESGDVHFYTEELKQKFLKLARADGSDLNPIILIQKLKK